MAALGLIVLTGEVDCERCPLTLTILLPAWKACLEELEHAVRIMPWDVCTCWNSTYDMLQFALEYKDAVKMVTSDLSNNLQKYELDNEEWVIAKELANHHLKGKVVYCSFLS